MAADRVAAMVDHVSKMGKRRPAGPVLGGAGFQPKRLRRVGNSFSIFESFYKKQIHLNLN
jgi:hypothetical protein